MTHSWVTLLLILGVLGMTSCASVPMADIAPGERPAIDTDEAGLWQAMDRDEYRLQTSSEVVRDPALQNYLETVLCRVAPSHCEDVRLYVLPGRNFNAFMAPNGMMAVFTGLLIRVASEAQLAAVIGHEVAHYQKRHSLQRFRDWRNKTNLLQATGAVLSAGVGVATASAQAAGSAGQYGRAIRQYDTARGIAQIGSSLLQAMEVYAILSRLEFSREQETEADQLGTLSIAEAGYPAEATGGIWAYMMEEEQHRERTLPTYLRTHPSSTQRQKAATLLVARTNSDDRVRQDGRVEYLAQIAPFRDKWLHHARQGMSFEGQRTLLDRQRQIGARPGLIAFHEAQMYRRRAGPDDADQALTLLQTAAKNEGHPVETWRELGMVLMDAGRGPEAKAAFGRYLELAPQAVDAALIRGYLSGRISQ